MPDLKQREILSFEPGTLSVRISGYGQQNYSGELIFDWSLVDHRPNEEDSGSHVAIDIPHSELIAIRDFLNRVIPLGHEPAESISDLTTHLKCAISHLDHMAAWISSMDRNKGVYSFESLGEDMPGIRAALTRSQGKAS